MKKTHAEKTGKLLPYIFMLTFISGVTAGAVFALFSINTDVLKVTDASKMTVFINSFTSLLKPCMVIWLCGFLPVSVYLSAGTLAYRGSILGFATGCIMKYYGLGAAICATLPQNIIFFPFLLFVSLAAAGQKKNSRSGYIITLILTFLICGLSALIDTYITSFLIKFIL